MEPEPAPAAAPTEDQTAAPVQDAPPAEGELLVHLFIQSLIYIHFFSFSDFRKRCLNQTFV